MKITIKKLGQYPWREGTVEGHHFQAAVYDEPSVYAWYGTKPSGRAAGAIPAPPL